MLLVVAALLFPIALTAFWAQKTLVDTQRYVETVAPLAHDAAVQDYVATTASNAVSPAQALVAFILMKIFSPRA